MDYKIGKSAGGEMHLSAAVLCPECNMIVELGTDDCPHAVAMDKAITQPPLKERDTRELLNLIADQLRKLGTDLETSHNSQKGDHECVMLVLNELGRVLAERHNRHDSEHMNLDTKLDRIEAALESKASTGWLIFRLDRLEKMVKPKPRRNGRASRKRKKR